MTASGRPPDMRARISALRKPGLNTSVSTACCHTSMRWLRHRLRASSACASGMFRGFKGLCRSTLEAAVGRMWHWLGRRVRAGCA